MANATNIVIHRVNDNGQISVYHSGLKSMDDAMCYLADVAWVAGAELIFEVDEEHPQCADALVVSRFSADQYTIQPDGFTIACR